MALTGNTRFRQTWRGKMVLQVEEKIHRFEPIGGTGYYDEWDQIRWRTAKSSDFDFPKVDTTFAMNKLKGQQNGLA